MSRSIQGNEQEGIVYTLTNQHRRSQIESYHHKPSPLDMSKTKFRVDVKGMKKKELANFIFDECGEEIESLFSIGFEIEKNDLHRDSIREYELFCGFETDSSCGYEAVTHILPLLPPSQWRTKVFDMMHKAERIIDDNWSPSNKKYNGVYQCGGHINISCKGMDGAVLKDTIRPYSGIIFALYRYRLTNKYCGHDRRMKACLGNNWSISYNSVYSGYAESNGWHFKYQPCLAKYELVEWRLPARVESVQQLMRRYELMYELMDFSVNVKGRREAFYKRIKPIVLSMMGGDEEECEKIFAYAKKFQTFINSGKIHDDIKKYL
jgi:hypothetical protein